MKRKIRLQLIAGFVLGAGSWGIVGLVSRRFEPFDDGLGFYIGQALLSLFAFATTYRRGIGSLLIFLLGSYIGMMTYVFMFGSSEQRASWLLGSLTSSLLLIFPLISGIIGKCANVVVIKQRRNDGM